MEHSKIKPLTPKQIQKIIDLTIALYITGLIIKTPTKPNKTKYLKNKNKRKKSYTQASLLIQRDTKRYLAPSGHRSLNRTQRKKQRSPKRKKIPNIKIQQTTQHTTGEHKTK